MIHIAAYPRSGTMYMSNLLTKLGKDIPHEKVIGKDGVVSWIYVGTGRIWARDIEAFPIDIIIHQVRNPLYVIKSALSITPEACNYLTDNIRKYCGEDFKFIDKNTSKEDRLYHAMWSWLRWNEIIESKNPNYFYRLEDLSSVFSEFCKIVGLPEDIEIVEIEENNSRNGDEIPLTWEDLEACDLELASLIKEKAKEYGYEEIKIIKKPKINKVKMSKIKFGGWAIDEEEYNWIKFLIKQENIKSVVEFGAGVSTHLFRSLCSVVTTFEPDAKFAKEFKDTEKHSIIVTSLYKPVEVDTKFQFDLAFVDSPPAMGVKKGKARIHPAKAATQLSNRVLMHDTKRVGEQNTITELFENEQWVKSECSVSKRGLTLFTRVK